MGSKRLNNYFVCTLCDKSLCKDEVEKHKMNMEDYPNVKKGNVYYLSRENKYYKVVVTDIQCEYACSKHEWYIYVKFWDWSTWLLNNRQFRVKESEMVELYVPITKTKIKEKQLESVS